MPVSARTIYRENCRGPRDTGGTCASRVARSHRPLTASTKCHHRQTYRAETLPPDVMSAITPLTRRRLTSAGCRQNGRPLKDGQRIHDKSGYRRAHFDAGEFARVWGCALRSQVIACKIKAKGLPLYNVVSLIRERWRFLPIQSVTAAENGSGDAAICCARSIAPQPGVARRATADGAGGSGCWCARSASAVRSADATSNLQKPADRSCNI